jgi:hypothetical protein
MSSKVKSSRNHGKTKNGITKSGKPDMRLKKNRMNKPGHKTPKGQALKKTLKKLKRPKSTTPNPNIPHQGTSSGKDIPVLSRDAFRWQTGVDLKRPTLDGRYRRVHENYLRVMGVPAKKAKAFIKAGHIPDEYFKTPTDMQPFPEDTSDLVLKIDKDGAIEGFGVASQAEAERIGKWTHYHGSTGGQTADGVKDSGLRRDFAGGAVRDGAINKGRPSLVPYFAEARVAQWYEKGARKYVERNWEKGIPLSVFYDSARHHLDKWKAGFIDEDHQAAAMWNMTCIIETEERIKRGVLPSELDDMPHTFEAFDDPDVFDVPKPRPGRLESEYAMCKDGKMRRAPTPPQESIEE